MMARYKTARAFRTALEDRLKRISQEQTTDLLRLRREVAFERMLARLFAAGDPPWLLKGGYAFELRLRAGARATTDLDLAVPAPSRIVATDPDPQKQIAAVWKQLQAAAGHDLNDWFVFRIEGPIRDLDGPPYGGARFPVEARLDNRTFAKFHLDVGIGDPVTSPPEWLAGHNLLDFAAIPPPQIAVLPREQQFAEKIHAFTLSRSERPNTRVKDLVDLVLLIDLGLSDDEAVIRAVRATFAKRQTHALPRTLPMPPASWREPYAKLAQECRLHFIDLEPAHAFVSTYWRTLQLTAPGTSTT